MSWRGLRPTFSASSRSRSEHEIQPVVFSSREPFAAKPRCAATGTPGVRMSLARSTRPTDSQAPDFVREFVSWGAGPRASQYLILAGKARALLDGRLNVAREDVRALAPAVLTHRVLTNFHAEAERVSSKDLVARLLESKSTP